MRRLPSLLAAVALTGFAEARQLGFGIDAFNRVVPSSASGASVFSPLSFEVDSVVFAEAVDPVRRALFANALNVLDEFSEEFRPLARMPFDFPGTNGVDLVWSHALVVDEPRRIDPTFRLKVQDLYGVEVCRAKPPIGIEAWIRTRFAGDFDGWRLPPLTNAQAFALHDLVSATVRIAPTNAWRRALPTHTVYRQPLVGGASFYALVPKAGRPVSSVRGRLTSATLPEILAGNKAVIDPPMPVRLSLPTMDLASTNELEGAFAYFHFPSSMLKPFPPNAKSCLLRQSVRFQLLVPPPAPDAEPLEGPFLFFIHDPFADTIPIAGLHPGKR